MCSVFRVLLDVWQASPSVHASVSQRVRVCVSGDSASHGVGETRDLAPSAPRPRPRRRGGVWTVHLLGGGWGWGAVAGRRAAPRNRKAIRITQATQPKRPTREGSHQSNRELGTKKAFLMPPNAEHTHTTRHAPTQREDTHTLQTLESSRNGTQLSSS